MATAAETYRDSLIRHQLALHRLSAREVERLVRQLRATEIQVANELRRRLEIEVLFGVDRGPVTTRRLNLLLVEIRSILVEAYAKLGQHVEQELFRLARDEAELNARLLLESLPAEIRARVAVDIPSDNLLRQIVSRRPFVAKGGLLRQYFLATGRHSLAKVAIRRYRKEIMGAVRTGLIEGKTVESVVRDLIKRVRGLTRNDLRAVTDTAIKAATQNARDAFLDANAGEDGVVKGHVWVSTLDERTTEEICVPRDGKRYDTDYRPVGHSQEWGAGPGRIHWRCRSTSVAWLKSWKELGIDAKEITGQTRASMNGQVPASLTAAEVRARAA